MSEQGCKTRGARETRETSERGRASGYQKGGAARAAHVLTLQHFTLSCPKNQYCMYCNHGDTVCSTAPTPTAFARELALVQSPSVTPYHAALAPSFQMTLGQTTMDSVMHMMTLTGRHMLRLDGPC